LLTPETYVEQLDRSVQHGHHGIHPAVVVDVSERHPAMWSFLLEIGTGFRTRIFEFPVPRLRKMEFRSGYCRSGTSLLMLSRTLERATNRSFQPSLSKSAIPFPHPTFGKSAVPVRY